MPRDNYTLLWGFLFYYRYFPRMSDIYGNNHTVINIPRMPYFCLNNTCPRLPDILPNNTE